MIKWESVISTGYNHIDDEHKEIFNIINEIYGKIINRDFNNINDILLNLIIYANDHLSHEEEIYMNFKGLNKSIDDLIIDHNNKHKLFIKNTIDMIKKYKDGNNVTIELAFFVKNWISEHISIDDLNLFNKINEIKINEVK